MCITVSEIRYQTWEEIYDEIIIITSRFNADRYGITIILGGQTTWKTTKQQQHLVGTDPILLLIIVEGRTIVIPSTHKHKQ
jgi:hypothetical protein